MMSDLQRALDEKKAEADEMFEIISDIQRVSADGEIENSRTKIAMLRSAFVLLLYNMVESTALLVFERVHERVADEHYEALGTELRVMWAEFFFSSHKSSTKHHEHLQGTLLQSLKFPLLVEFSKRSKLFSGNLDGKKLDETLKRYGIEGIRVPGKIDLEAVKLRRNVLAHGEQTFRDAGRDLSDEDLGRLKRSTFAALDDLIELVEAFLANRSYLAPRLAR